MMLKKGRKMGGIGGFLRFSRLEFEKDDRWKLLLTAKGSSGTASRDELSIG